MRNKIIKMVSTKLKPKKKKLLVRQFPFINSVTKSEIQSGKVFQKKKKKYIYIYIYQRGKGTLYIKLSMLQENSLSNQT